MAEIETTPKKILDKMESGVAVKNVTGEGINTLNHGSTDGGTTWVPVKVDASGHLQVDVLGDFVLVPIGSVLSWLKTYTNTPALSASFVECNGQVLDDGDSVYDGQTIPNLNGNNQFARGNSTSGATGGSATHVHTGPSHAHSGPSHYHTQPEHNHYVSDSGYTAYESSHSHYASGTTNSSTSTLFTDLEVTGSWSRLTNIHTHTYGAQSGAGTSHRHSFSMSDTSSSDGDDNTGSAGTGNTGSAGTGNTGSAGTLPSYYNVVWIMRIK